MTKLAAELEQRYDSLVVRLDLVNNLDIRQANPVEVLFLMGAATFKVAEAALPADRPPDRGLLEKLKEGLETLVRTQTEDKQFKIDLGKLLAGLVVFGAAGLVGGVAGGPAGAAAAVAGVAPVVKKYAGLNPFRFFSGTDAKVVRKLEVEPHVEGMIEALNAILDDVRAKTGQPLVLLVDGLDRLRDPEVIRLNFVERDFLNGPKCSVVYVGPLDLYYTPEVGQVQNRFAIEPLMHVKLHPHKQPEQPHLPGCEILGEVVKKRLKTLQLGTNHLFASEDILMMLIKGSAGVMRDFIRLIQSSALEAELAGVNQITGLEARAALNGLRRDLSAPLTPKYREVLAAVRNSHQRVDGDACDLLLRNGVILGYRNDDIWFAPHAALSESTW